MAIQGNRFHFLTLSTRLLTQENQLLINRVMNNGKNNNLTESLDSLAESLMVMILPITLYLSVLKIGYEWMMRPISNLPFPLGFLWNLVKTLLFQCIEVFIRSVQTISGVNSESIVKAWILGAVSGVWSILIHGLLFIFFINLYTKVIKRYFNKKNERIALSTIVIVVLTSIYLISSKT